MRGKTGSSLFAALVVLCAASAAHAQTFDYATCDPAVVATTDCSSTITRCCKQAASAGSSFLLSGTDKAIIIPMDYCHQAISASPTTGAAPTWCSNRPNGDGMLLTYGLIYRLLQAGIPVYWIVNPSKDPVALGSPNNNSEITTDIDFWVLDSAVANPPGNATALTAVGANPVVKHMTGGFTAPNFSVDAAYSYTKKEFPIRGSAFMIKASDRATFNKFVNRQSPYTNWATRSGCGNGGFCYDFRAVNMYEIQSTAKIGWTDFRTASAGGVSGATGFRTNEIPITATMTYTPPKIAKIPDTGVSQKWLGQANLQDKASATCATTGIFSPTDSVYCEVTEADIQAGRLKTNGFGWLWIDHQQLSCGATMTKVREFLTSVASTYTPGNVMAIAEGVGNESCANQQLLGKEQGGQGLTVSNGSGPSPLILRYPQSLYMQWGDAAPDFANGLSGGGWTFYGGSNGYNTAFATGNNSLHRLATGDVSNGTSVQCTSQKSSAACDKASGGAGVVAGAAGGSSGTGTSAQTGYVGVANGDSQDITAYGRFENVASNGIVYYLPGTQIHQHTSELRMLLDSVLATPMGTVTQTPPVITEISRASPVIANIANRSALVQGTYEYVNPAPAVTTVTTGTDLSSFEFPYLQGHMRAVDAGSIGTNGITFNTATKLFDAGDTATLPPVTYTGCSGPPYSGSCRTLFTNLSGSGYDLALTPIDEGHYASLAAPLGVSSFSVTDQKTFIDRLLAGHYNSTTTSWEPKLGGVDRSTVAVIEASPVTASRPKIAYFGGTDGMLHAVCASLLGNCTTLGREVWAFVPRVNLPNLRLNTARIDGSPRVIDLLGDFSTGTGGGTKTFHTILIFQTGAGDATTGGNTYPTTPAIYGLDVTDPFTPHVLFEYTTPASPGSYNVGQGLTVAAGSVNVSGNTKLIAYAQTNNGGTIGAGTVVTPIDLTTGTNSLGWTFTYAYPSPPRVAADAVVPTTGMPGGAVQVDKTGAGFITDLTFADLYGNLWLIDPATGTSRYNNSGGTKIPMFSFSDDYHAIGGKPAIYSDGTQQYAVIVSGGYADNADSTWGSNVQQYLLVLSLNYPTASTTPFDENDVTYVKKKVPFASTAEKGYAQALIVGNEIFFTTDTTDVNSSGYGVSGATGKAYRYNMGTNASGTTVLVGGGGGSVANDSTNLYTGSGQQTQQLGTGAASATNGYAVDGVQAAKVTRTLWLRTE